MYILLSLYNKVNIQYIFNILENQMVRILKFFKLYFL